MRTLCAATLVAEAMIIGFAGLAAMELSGLSAATVWAVSGPAMLLCVVLCGVVNRPWGVMIGWVLQVALVASGFVVPLMFVLGVAFGALWWAAVYYGRRIDMIKAARAAEGA
ncbi:hypothetical protein AQ490_10710 [Wenjunlia vitaminophila]|uniref:DUF4233 domain-containing protein n=1 Tax=Wenjunlia vitaminophila TaxID=76728 RepID=A0A0T6LKH2_WENVI|nr:DUF4233 domain-containing protein [Wenjunlia vitaminophila]KRV46383.1 hypothetical protein AQ490_10710 [Wenjunlia vitaminophila]